MSQDVKRLYALIGKMGADWVASQLSYIADPESYLRKVYIVEESHGEHILRGIYGNRAEAEHYCKSDLSCRWFERELDQLPGEMGLLLVCFRVRMNLKDGSNLRIDRQCTIAQATVGQAYASHRSSESGEYWEFTTYMWARDESHANEVAEQRRVDWASSSSLDEAQCQALADQIVLEDSTPTLRPIFVDPKEVWYEE